VLETRCRAGVATHLLESGIDVAALTLRLPPRLHHKPFLVLIMRYRAGVQTVQDLLGHTDVATTMVYLHVMKRPGAGGPSPLDMP
jgi:integrase